MIPAVIARVLLVVFALGVCVWAGVLARDAHLQEQGTELGIKGLKDAAVLPTALGDLHDAALLNLDTTPKVLRARVLAATGHPREATALAYEHLGLPMPARPAPALPPERPELPFG